MKQFLIVMLSVCGILTGCSNQPATDSIPEDEAARRKAAISQLDNVMKKYEEPAQVFSMAADKPGMITGKHGTKISVNPDDLVTESGKPLGADISVELKELTDRGRLLRANASTTSDGKLLVSGGAYFIGMTSGGEQLKLKEGRKLRVQFPELSDKEMALFYGQRDSLGRMNWKQAPDTFRAARKVPPSDTAQKIIRRRESDIDAILDYAAGGDSVLTKEERIMVEKLGQEAGTSQRVYQEIGLDKLGWINCDRFMEIGDLTRIAVHYRPQDSVVYAYEYLVFKDINSVVMSGLYPGVKTEFGDMPVGYKAKFIAYTIKGGKIFGYATDLTITRGQQLNVTDLKEMNDSDLKKLLGN